MAGKASSPDFHETAIGKEIAAISRLLKNSEADRHEPVK
jgi:hypothetical protein